MRYFALLTLLSLLWIGCGNNISAPTIPASPVTPSTIAATGLKSEENEFLKLINALRSESGLQSLTIDAALQAAADHHSAYMVSFGTLSHFEPSPNSSSYDRILNEGGDFNFTGENVALNSGDAATTFDAWYSSPGHRENMLSEQFQYIGISQKGSYWTTDFAGK